MAVTSSIDGFNLNLKQLLERSIQLDSSAVVNETAYELFSVSVTNAMNEYTRNEDYHKRDDFQDLLARLFDAVEILQRKIRTRMQTAKVENIARSDLKLGNQLPERPPAPPKLTNSRDDVDARRPISSNSFAQELENAHNLVLTMEAKHESCDRVHLAISQAMMTYMQKGRESENDVEIQIAFSQLFDQIEEVRSKLGPRKIKLLNEDVIGASFYALMCNTKNSSVIAHRTTGDFKSQIRIVVFTMLDAMHRTYEDGVHLDRLVITGDNCPLIFRKLIDSILTKKEERDQLNPIESAMLVAYILGEPVEGFDRVKKLADELNQIAEEIYHSGAMVKILQHSPLC